MKPSRGDLLEKHYTELGVFRLANQRRMTPEEIQELLNREKMASQLAANEYAAQFAGNDKE